MSREAPEPVRIMVTRAGEMAKLLDSGNLDAENADWCRTVLENNPPGQRIYVEAETVEACESQAECEVYREIIH